VVEGSFSDGSTRPLEEDEYELLPPDMRGVGPRIGRVRAGELDASFSILINNSDSVLSSLEVRAPPEGLLQDFGQSLNTAALEVRGIFTGPGGEEETRILTAFSTSGYDRAKRGEQTVTVSVNGKTATFPLKVRIPPHARVETALLGSDPNPQKGHDTAFIKGQSLERAAPRIRATVSANGTTAVLYTGDGIDYAEVHGFNPAQPGMQTLTLDLDGLSPPPTLDVYVADLEPEIYFDHGFMRTAEDPEGRGRNRGEFLGDGAFHTLPNRPLVLSPVRVLIGYGPDHGDRGANYRWTVDPSAGMTVSPSGEFLTLKPQNPGTWTVTVEVTGQSYLDGLPITKTASATVICDPPPSSYAIPRFSSLFNPSPGQFTESGTGYHWSLGTIGGYAIYSVTHKPSYRMEGNAFEGWTEPGIIWFQEDLNGNGLPDEIWYEVDAGRGPYISRGYSVKFFKSGGGTQSNSYGQTLRSIYWADGKGRTGKINGGWPKDFGVSNEDGAWVTYTATIMADNNSINSDFYLFQDLAGPGGTVGGPFTDHGDPNIPVSRAVDAAGNPVTLTNVRFVKAQTGVFKYGGVFGEVSTEPGAPQ
jgi:hypothetical protein